MILVDTSVWVEHLRRGNTRLEGLLLESKVLCHPFVTGEIALGHLRNRELILERLADLPQAPVAEHPEALTFAARNTLAGSGIGWVDLHLLASASLGHARLWSLDRRLAGVARRLDLQE